MKKIEIIVLAVIKRKDKFLLTYRVEPEGKPKSVYVGWQLPGGKLEFGEKPQDSLKREIKEEVGFEINIIRLLSKIFSDVRTTKNGQWQGIFIPYLCEMQNPQNKIVLNKEASKYGWFSLNEVKSLKTLPLDYEIIKDSTER